MRQNTSNSEHEENTSNEAGDAVGVIQTTTAIYPSANLLHETIQREYDIEDDRSKTFDTRVGIFVSLAGAILAFMATSIKFPDIKNIKIDNVYQAMPYAFFVIFLSIAFLMLIASFLCFFKVVSIHRYLRIGLEDLSNENNSRAQVDVVAMVLVGKYYECLIHNGKVNEAKSRFYQWGVFLVLGSLVMNCFLSILNIIFFSGR